MDVRLSRPAWLETVAGDGAFDWARRAWDVAAAIAGNWFDYALADKAVETWPRLFCHTEGRWAGKPFVLAQWQEIIVRLLVGWKNAEGFRHFRLLILWVARKNGKSEFMAALALLFFIGDEEKGGQVYNFARNEKQANVIFKKAKAMIAMSPQLREVMKATKRTMYHPELNSLWELLAGNAEGKHGLSASVIVGDEAHECISDSMYTTLHQSTAARDQPIELIGSTAGHKNRGWGWSLWENCRAILEGRLVQPETLVVVFAAPADAAIDDETAWAQANPNLGISPRLEYLRRNAPRRKKTRGWKMTSAAITSTNGPTRSPAGFRSRNGMPARLTRKAGRRFAPGLKGRTCFGALDLSSVRDVTALIWLFPPVDGEENWTIVCRFFVPEDTAAERSRADRVEYDRWIAQGAMEPTPTATLSTRILSKKAVLEDGAFFHVENSASTPGTPPNCRWNCRTKASRCWRCARASRPWASRPRNSSGWSLPAFSTMAASR
jgi:phage terminase large subunit-like protein